jgi:hypothetical protein
MIIYSFKSVLKLTRKQSILFKYLIDINKKPAHLNITGFTFIEFT